MSFGFVIKTNSLLIAYGVQKTKMRRVGMHRRSDRKLGEEGE
jgi:hypothetical protein